MGKTRRGGAQWKSGVDTCVFKPAVRCSAREPRREGMVSRVRPGGTAGRDFVIEHRIRTSFPKLVAEGRVIVFDEICSVEYEDEDLKTSPELVACANLGVKKGPQEHANFITPEMDGSLRDYPGSPQTIVGPAVMAAVDMVPDNGPWIIHMDLHPANVLYKVEGDHVRTALADWGRALHIEKPNDIASVRKGIMQWMNSDGDFDGQPLSAFRDALGELDWNVAPHMAALLTDPVVGMEEHLAAIRGWSLDYLLRRLDIEVGDTLLTAPNQAELRKRCQALLAPKGGFSARGRVMGKTRRGGKKWKQGADTCVFDPPVACADGTAIPPNSISRIRSAEDAARDVLIEDTVKRLLGPDAKGVVTYSVKCSPKYTPEDLQQSDEIAREEEIRGCDKIAGTTEEDMNLVTAKQVRTLHEHGKKGARKVIRPAVDAAVNLVPDSGPWVIHADCHTGNVLIGEDGFAAMSDWGRAVLIKDPSNIESVREGIRDWIATTDARNLRQVLTEMRAPQHPPEIIANLLPLMEMTNDEDGVPIPPSADAVRIAMQHLRGWVPYVLIKHVAGDILGLDAVLRTNTQSELREAVNKVFAPVAKGGKTRRGGMAMWRQGADTCVFKPAVRCSAEEERTPGHVSRILNREDATTDVSVEEALRTKHPDIVRMKLVSVHARSCTPYYTESDTAAWEGDEGGCTRLGDVDSESAVNHINLITPEMDVGTLSGYFNKRPAPGAEDRRAVRKSNWRNVILGAISAAIELVPDDNEWIVHGDCHFGNVLLWRSPERSWPISALADWGRSLVIKDPNDLASVRAGIRKYTVSSGWIDQGVGTDRDVARVLGQMKGEGYDQLPDAVMQSLGNLMVMKADDEDGFKRRMFRIRGWVPYVLVKQALPVGDQLIDRATGVAIDINDLLTRPNQTELANLVTRILTSLPNPEDEGDELEPIPGALAEPVAPAAAPAAVVTGPKPPMAFPPMVPAAGPREGGMYWPTKYSRGLTRRQNAQRKRSATRRTKMKVNDPKAYVSFKSDKGVKTRRSSYTQRFHKKYPEAKTLPEIAKATGVSKSVLEKVYDRGMAAWRTGHRPGASQQAWGMARVHSFVLKGKTYRTADKDLA